MAQIRWSDIESRPWFAPLSPEEKIGVLDRWTQDQLGGLGSDEEKLVFEASSDALKQSYLGNPMPQDMNKYVQDYALKKAQAKVQQEAERDLPFVSLTDTASSLWDAVRGLPPTLKASYYQLKESSVRPDQRSEDYKRAMLERDAYLDELERVEADQQTDVGNAIRGAAGSLAFTGVGMGAAITGGALGRAVGTPVGAAIGGAIAGAPTAGAGIAPGAVAGAAIGGQIGQYAGSLGASALAAYNLAYEDFRYEAFKQAEQNKGAPLSEEEADALDKQIAPLAENTAAWEAGPEALGNVVTLGGAKLIYGLTKDAFTDIGKRTLGRLAKAGAIQAGSTGLELTTEAITQYNQAYDQAKLAALLQGKPLEEAVKPYEGISGLVEAGKEVAPTVLALQGLLGGGAALAGRLTSKKPIELTEEAFRQTLDQQRAAATLLRNAQETATGEEAPSIFKRVDAFNRLKMLDKAADTLAGGDVEGAAGMLGVKIVTPQQAAVTAATPPPAQTQTPPPVGNTPAQTALPAVVANTAQVAAENNAPLTATTLVNTSADLADAAKRADFLSSLLQGLDTAIPGVPAVRPPPQVPFAPSPAAVTPAVVETPTLAPTPTTDATLQRQVPENRVEERQDVDAGGPTAEAGGGNRPVQGGQEQAQEENVTALLQNLRQSVTAGGRKDWSPAEYAAAQQFFATGDEATLATLSDVQASRVKSVAKRGLTAAPAPVAAAPVLEAEPAKLPERKPTKTLGRNAFGTYDLLDFLQENRITIPKAAARKGAGEYDWLRQGDLKSVLPSIAYYTDREAANVDTVAQQAYEANLIASPTADALIEGIRSTWAARQQSRAAGVASGQGVAPGAEKIRKDFEKAIYGRTGTLVDFEDIRVGDKLTISGQEMTVTEMVFPEDETATVPETIFVDGPFFGRQPIGTDTPVRVDSIEKAERPADEFAPEMEQVPTESLPAGQPTSGDVGTALRAIATNTATPEQVASLEEQGLARTVQGQPVITDAGLALIPEAERPRLTEAERVAEIESQAAPALTLESATEEQLAQEAKQAEDRQRIAEGQARRLTGTAGEMGTPDMLDVTAGETPLFSQPAPAPAAEAAPAPAAEAAPAPAAEAAPAPVSEKIGKVRAKREDLFAKFRKKSGQASMGIDPELAAIAAEIAATYVEEGVIRFSDFASRVKADAADLWGQIRRYLHGAWTSSGTVNPNIDEVTRAEAAKILDDLDAAPTPVEEAAPQKEELPTDLVDEDSVPTPPPAGEPATPEERNAKLGFGQNKRLSVNQLLAQGKQNYLFETLLDDTQMAAALRSNSDAVRRAQGVVRRMPEYQDYLAEKAKTPQQREQENAPFVERVTQGIDTIEISIPVICSTAQYLATEFFIV